MRRESLLSLSRRVDVGIDRRVGRRLKNVSRPGSSLRSDPEPRQPEPPAETF